VLIEDNQVRSAGGSGIYVVSASDIDLSRNSVEDCVQHGVDVNDATRVLINGGFVTRSGARISGKSRKGIKFTGTSDSTIEGTAVFDNSDIGVYLVDGTTGVRVRAVVAHHNARGFERAASGIESRSDGNIIESNITYENEDSGINLRWGGSNGLIINNVANRNGDHGIDVLDSLYARVINNTVYKNITAGINVEGSSANAVIANNISVGNAVDSPRTEGDIRVTSASMPAQADYNIVYASGSEKIYQWGTHYYRTLRYLQNEFPGVEVNGLQADPKWMEPSLNDFHLKSGSAAIDSAESNAIQTAEIDKDAQGNSRCDDPNTPNTGGGPRTFDDRGALEYIDMSYCPIASASE
jgi:parallel beta-helix repeat protein